MIKDLGEYLANNETIHEFRLKIAAEPTDEQLDALELHLRKYDAFDISTPKKTIIQRNPRDFRDIGPSEVYMIDFKTRLPASPTHLLSEISQKIGVHEKFLVVRNKLEPLHVEDEDQEKDDGEYTPRLTDEEYSEYESPNPDKYFGEKFKKLFLKDLEKMREEKLKKVK